MKLRWSDGKKWVVGIFVFALTIPAVARTQGATEPPLQPGVHVEMPIASHVVAMPAADQPDATIVAVTADGQVFLGVEAVEENSLSGELSGINHGTVYLKIDAKAPYQTVLTVLDALRGRPIVLIAAPASKPVGVKPVPPYGIKLTVEAQ